MDLGIKNKVALVCASSKGLGKACAMELARAGTNVYITARTEDVLEKTAEEIREKSGQVVRSIAADITTSEGREKILAVCPQPDILVNNAGGPPPGDFRGFSIEDWNRALNANMLTPIELIKATVDGMIERKFGRIVNITSAAVKAPIDILALSNGARSGLTGFVAGLSRETIKHNVTINGILPGLFETDTMKWRMREGAKMEGISEVDYTRQKVSNIPAGRPGVPEEFGKLCAYICSVHTSFISGQNFLIDGGAYPGTF